jgi:hypothetical protein
MLLGRMGKATDLSEIAYSLVGITDSPHRHPMIQCIRYSQNVAGLWLKYGASAPNDWDFRAQKESACDATIS